MKEKKDPSAIVVERTNKESEARSSSETMTMAEDCGVIRHDGEPEEKLRQHVLDVSILKQYLVLFPGFSGEMQ